MPVVSGGPWSVPVDGIKSVSSTPSLCSLPWHISWPSGSVQPKDGKIYQQK